MRSSNHLDNFITNLSKNQTLNSLQLNIKLCKYLKIIKILQNPNLEKIVKYDLLYLLFSRGGLIQFYP